MSSILETLKSLKNKLISFESTQSETNDLQTSATNKQRETSNINDKTERLNKKLDILHKDQSNRIKINVGGKIFEMSSEMILNTLYPNIFIKEISSSHLTQNLEIFFDGNSKLFKYIYKIFGIFQNSNKNQFSESNKYKLNVSADTDVNVLKGFMRQIFHYNNNFLKLLKLIEIKGSEDYCQANAQSTNQVDDIPETGNNYSDDEYVDNTVAEGARDYDSDHYS